MDRYMSGSQFGVKAVLRVSIFLALTFGFPFIVYGLVLATNARSVGGASGALAAVAGIYLKPVIVLVFVLSMIGICWRRMRSLGLPGFCGLLVPFLVLMDGTYLLVVGTHWGTAFSLGIMHVSLPAFAMVALATMIAMASALPPSGHVASGQLFRGLLWCCAVLAVLLVVTALMTSSTMQWIKLLTISFGGRPSSALLGPPKAVYYAYLLKPWICVAFCAAMASVTILSRLGSRGNASGGGSDGDLRPTPPAPIGAGAVVFGER